MGAVVMICNCSTRARLSLCKLKIQMNRMPLLAGMQGRSVVRLKGGCPSVFSRAHSEMAALAANDIEFELVPGVSSALAGQSQTAYWLAGQSHARTARRVGAIAHDAGHLEYRCWLVCHCVGICVSASSSCLCPLPVLAAPLFAGFPLTHPQLSRGFAVTSAHKPAEVDWRAYKVGAQHTKSLRS